MLRDKRLSAQLHQPFGKTFNEQSNQPQMSGQISEAHAFGPNTVNEFKGSTRFYSAVFVPSDASGALAALPTYLAFTGSTFSTHRRLGRSPLPSGIFLPAAPACLPISDPGPFL